MLLGLRWNAHSASLQAFHFLSRTNWPHQNFISPCFSTFHFTLLYSFQSNSACCLFIHSFHSIQWRDSFSRPINIKANSIYYFITQPIRKNNNLIEHFNFSFSTFSSTALGQVVSVIQNFKSKRNTVVCVWYDANVLTTFDFDQFILSYTSWVK